MRRFDPLELLIIGGSLIAEALAVMFAVAVAVLIVGIRSGAI